MIIVMKNQITVFCFSVNTTAKLKLNSLCHIMLLVMATPLPWPGSLMYTAATWCMWGETL